MGTIEIHEPEVNEVKPASRPNAGVPPKKDVAQAFAPRVMFSDSLLDFGQARKRKAFATTTSFIFNCVAIGLMLAVPLMFTDELPKAQLLTFLMAPPPLPRLLPRQRRRWKRSSIRSRRTCFRLANCARRPRFHARSK